MKFRIISLITLLQFCCYAFPQLTDAGPASNQTSNVNVVNTPNVTVANTPNVNVANIPSVLLSGTPVVGFDSGNNTVKLDVGNNFVKEANNPAFRPFQTSVGPVAVTQGPPSVAFLTHVATGSRLVIEQVTSHGSVAPGAFLEMDITTNLSGTDTSHALVASTQGTDGNQDYFAGSQVTRLYADADTDVVIHAQGINGGGTAFFTISGYLVSP